MATEVVSVIFMETAEVLAEIYTPGVMTATYTQAIFWFGMLWALVCGYIAALPVNYLLIKFGVRKGCH